MQALKGVSFELRAGEVHALIGENGAGKSTLIKIMTGAVTPDSGRLKVNGHLVTHHSPAHGESLGIAAVYQQPALFPHLTVAENIALVRRARACGAGWTGRPAPAARELLERAGAEIGQGGWCATLSMPEQQIVEIAKAIGAKAKSADPGRADGVADRPRSGEPVPRDRVRCAARGVGIVYISHRLEEIAAIADRVTVLRDGQTIATRDSVKEVDRAELIRLMVGRDIAAIFPEARGSHRRGGAGSARPLRVGRRHSTTYRFGEKRRDPGIGGPGGLGPHRTGGDAVRADTGRRAARF